MAESVVANKHQCADFKLNPDKKWEQFTGKKLDQQAKLNGTIMCPRWHMRGNCFKDARTEPATLPAPRSCWKPNKLTLSG
jgi:hypothetical protein